MPDFKKKPHFSNGSHRPFQKADSRHGNNRGFDQKELYETDCSNCHKKCQVPFRPNGKKPVFCSDCFKKNDDRPQQDRYERREYAPSRENAPAAVKDSRIDDIKRQLDAMNATLQHVVSLVETSTRATALTKEMKKYVTPAKPASAPAKVAKTAAKPAAKKVAKKAAKKKA